jgi:hypothetical protein
MRILPGNFRDRALELNGVLAIVIDPTMVSTGNADCQQEGAANE